MNEEIFKNLGQEFAVKAGDLNTYSPLVLAYVGDAVYELYVRTLLLSKGNAPVHKLHKQSISYVKAKAQSDIIHKLMETLKPEELDIVKRAETPNQARSPKMPMSQNTSMPRGLKHCWAIFT